MDMDYEYPCSCGHCTECGMNFVPTREEMDQWAREDEDYMPGEDQWNAENGFTVY